MIAVGVTSVRQVQRRDRADAPVTDPPSRVSRAAAIVVARSRLVDLLVIAVGYLAYALVRGLHGHDESSAAYARAVDNAHEVMAVQGWLQLPTEAAAQERFLHATRLVEWIGGFYGGAHFLVTFAALLWLVFARPHAYAWWRNCLAATTAVALAVFALYPTAPPRLLEPHHPQRTVDTLDVIGGLWSYNRGVLEHISDPFAAMPSLHLGWATWVALALYWTGRRTRRRLLACVAYPVVTAVAVIVTGTHWYLDIVAGVLLAGLVVGAAAVLTGGPPTAPRRRLRRREASMPIIGTAR